MEIELTGQETSYALDFDIRQLFGWIRPVQSFDSKLSSEFTLRSAN